MSSVVPVERIHYSSPERKGNNKVSPVAKAGFECAKRAEDVLMHMQQRHEYRLQSVQYNSEIQPDTRVFNLVLKAWANIRGGTKASAIRAMRILDLMQELYHDQSMHAPNWQGVVLSKVQPNLQTYKHVNMLGHMPRTPTRAPIALRRYCAICCRCPKRATWVWRLCRTWNAFILS